MISCRRSRALLVEHVRGAVGEAALFQLDQHLAACAACRVERARWQTVRALRDGPPAELSAAARARIARRLGEGRPPTAPRRPTVARPRLLVGLAIASALPLVAWLLGAPRAVEPLRADRAGTLQFGGAQLGYRAGTVAELRRRAHAVALEAGELEVSLRAGAPPLRVSTRTFVVTIEQSHAVFAADSVRVLDGEVRVFTTDERPLATVTAGERWPRPPVAPPPVENPPVAPPPAAATPRTTHAHAAGVTAALALDRARSALAAGDAREARRWIQRALAAASSPRDRAEAELFTAESYLVDQQPERAVAAYRQVAGTWAQQPEGEAAAFAAAQVLGERGRAAESEAAFRDYLARYPDGRFAREARDRLAAAPQ
jgi:hypothetical protein